MSDYDFRFGGIARLYGEATLQRLRQSRVMIIGIGGVGSWIVEALARTGVGHLILVDLDEVCVSNVNRQLPAMDSTLGRPKAEVMAERVRAIAPESRVDVHLEFFTAETAERLLGLAPSPSIRPDLVIDAIDSVSNKTRLIALCHAHQIPIVVCGGAGGRRDPTAVRISDLAQVTHDRLVSAVRQRLRRHHGFPRDEKRFGIDCVCSSERPVFPDASGGICANRSSTNPNEPMRLNCDSGFGSATFVTGTFGFAAAAHAIQKLARIAPAQGASA